jgi:hypothetical protein
MKRDLTIRRTILAMALAAIGVSGMAIAAPEVEPNNTYLMPQSLDLDVSSGGVSTITGSIASASDVDFYTFMGTVDPANPMKVAIDIDVDHTKPGLEEHQLVVYVFDPNGTRRFALTVASYDPVNDPQSAAIPGTNLTLDPRLLDLKIDKQGPWTLAVAALPLQVTTGGVVKGVGDSVGEYALIVSGLKPSMPEIALDIKPGNDEVSVLNPKAKGVIPVALLSEEGFDPFEVDPSSLTFGRMGDEKSYVRCAKDGRDLNGDGKPDRVCHFDNEKAGFIRTDTTAKVKGTKNGKPFQGTGDLKVVPQKHKN